MNRSDRIYWYAVGITVLLLAGSLYFGGLAGTQNHAISVLQPYLFLLGVPMSFVAGVLYLVYADKIENWLVKCIPYMIGAGFAFAIIWWVFFIMFGVEV